MNLDELIQQAGDRVTIKQVVEAQVIEPAIIEKQEVIMPDVEPGEPERDYIKRCIPIALEDGTAKDGAQAYAICISKWEAAQGGEKADPKKTDAGDQYSAEAYLVVPDKEQVSTWSLRIEETPGKITVRQLGRAAAALGPGFRGQKVDLEPDVKKAAAKKLIALYRKEVEDEDIPVYLWEIAGEQAPGAKKDTEDVKQGNIDKLAEHLVNQYGDDPGFYTRCVDSEEVKGYDEETRAAICAKAHEIATGRWPAEDEKAGKRIKSEKVGLLKSIQEGFAALGDRIKELMGWAEYEDQEPAGLDNFFEVGLKTVNGEPWIFAYSTNAFKDRQDEIFSTDSLETYVGEAEKNDNRGFFNFWHIPNSDFAAIKWQGVSGRFLVEAGPFMDTHQGRAAKAFFTKHSSSHPDIAPEGWGCSPEFRYLPEDRKEGVFGWIWKTKTSVLPRGAAANINTKASVQEADMLSEKQLQAANELFGKEWVDEHIVKEAEQRTKELEEAGVAFKAKDGLDKYKAAIKKIADGCGDEKLKKSLEGVDLSDIKAAAKALRGLAKMMSEEDRAALEAIADEMEPTEAKKEEPQPIAIDVKALADELVARFDVKLEPLNAELEGIVGKMAELHERMTKMEKVEAVKSQTASPRFVLQAVKRASEAEETVVKDGDPLLDKKPAEGKPLTYAGQFFKK